MTGVLPIFHFNKGEPIVTFRNSKLLFMVVLLLNLLTGSLQAATIDKINKKKGLLLINEGKSSGLKPKAKVCVYGPDGKKITCGVITKVKDATATVKVSKKKIVKVAKGMEVKLADGSEGAEGEAAGGAAKPGHSYIKGLYILSPMTTATYQKVTYQRPEAASVDTLWKAAEASGLSLFGVGGEVGLDLSGKLLAAGARLKRYREFTAVADYDNDPANYVENNQVAQSFGVWLDYYWMTINMGGSKLEFANGLDIDMSTMVLNAAQLSDAGDENEIYKATSKITVMSLRNVLSYKLFFDPIGINADINVMLPLVASGASFSADVNDGNTASLTVDPVEDLKATVDHKKAGLGLELIFGAYFAF